MAKKASANVRRGSGESAVEFVRFEVRFDVGVYERLRVMAEAEGLSLNRVAQAAVLMACEQYEAGELQLRRERERFVEKTNGQPQ